MNSSEVTTGLPGPQPKQREVSPAIVVLLVGLLATFMLYLPGTYGPFLHDDRGQITMNHEIKIDALTLENLSHADNKYPSRPLPMMSFAVNYLQCGESPSCYKVTNISLHLATGLALCFLLWSLSLAAARRALFSLPGGLIVAAVLLWLLHPLQVSTTLYVVQRMTIMATLFSVLALGCYVHARFVANTARQRLAWSLTALTCIVPAALSKENFILVIPLALLIEVLLLEGHTRARISRPWLLGLALTIAFFALLWLLAAFPPKRIAAGYLQRDFLPMERLLTEARILWYYVSEIAWPDQARMSLFLDNFTISRSLVNPASTLAAVGGWLLVIALCAGQLLRKPSPVVFGILFFAGCHLLESTVFGLVLAYEHRNYLASLGLLLAATWLVFQWIDHARMRIAVLTLLIALVGWQMAVRVAVWSNETAFVSHLLDERWADSYTTTMELGQYFSSQAGAASVDSMAQLYYQKSNAAYARAAALTSQPTLPLTTLLMRATTPEEALIYWRQLQAIAATSPVTPDVLNAANTMAVCLLSPYCPLAGQEFATYIDALIANPRKNRVSTTLLKRAAGTFYVKIANQTDKGLTLSREAAELGMPEARESYIKNLGYLGRTAEAMAAYERFAAEVELSDERRQRIEDAIAAPGVVMP